MSDVIRPGPCRPAARRAERGHSLLEVMLALALLVAGGTASLRVLVTVVGASVDTERKNQMRLRASSLHERLQRSPAPALRCLAGNPGNFAACEARCAEWAGPAAEPGACRLTLAGQERDRQGNRYSLIYDFGDPARGSWVKPDLDGHLFEYAITVAYVDESGVPGQRLTLRSAVFK